GFGPTPSLTTVAMQNAIAHHQLGTAIGAMNFSRNLFTTMLVALLGAIVLSATAAIEPAGPGAFGGEPAPSAEAADAVRAFSRVFFTVAGCFAIAFVSLLMLEERPLRASGMDDGK